MNKNNILDNESNKIIIYAAIASLIIAKDLNTYQLNLAGNFFQAVGQNLEVLASYLSAKNSNTNCNKNI